MNLKVLKNYKIKIICYLKRTLEKNGQIYFAIENDCLDFVKGGILDFESDIHKTSFVVKENPNAELTCSCKKSFAPKFNQQ